MLKRIFLAVFVAALFVSMLVSSSLAQTEDHILVQGVPMGGSSNGLAFDSEGHLVVANVWRGTISVMDVANGEVLATYGSEYEMLMPDDVALGPDGLLYFTQEGPMGGVGCISETGEVMRVAALPWSNPIGFSEDERMFVAQCLSPENGLYEIDPTGVREPRLIVDGLPGCAVNAFDFGPDGFLYGPSVYQGAILRIDVESGEMTTAVEGLTFPAAVEFDSKGRLHIADQATGEIIRVDLETGARETLAILDVGLDNLVFDAEDRLYVSSAIDGFIVEVLEDGTTRMVSEGGMVAPAGIAVQGDSIFVAEPQSIREFDRFTGVQIDLERSVFSVSEVGSPITVSANENMLILTSWFDNSVRVFNWETREAVAIYNDFAVPVNAIRFQGDLIVAELGTTSIVRANGDDPSQRETLATLVVPGGLAATEDDLWASDWATGMIWQLVADGEALEEPQAVGEGFAFPEGLAVTPEGILIVVETGTKNLIAFDPVTGERQVIAEELAVEPPPPQGLPMPPTFFFDGVAVASDGMIYVSGRAANVIYQYNMGD